jgi:single-strand DNA-binding protein
MAYELSGKIKLLQDPKTFDSGFTKREMVVIVEDGKYPQEINLEFVQDKVALLDKLQWLTLSQRSQRRRTEVFEYTF